MKVNTMTKCEYCNKNFQNQKSLKYHRIRCKENPNMKFWNNGCKKCQGHTAWNKGLTKETDQRLAKSAQTYSDNYKAGTIKIKGHPHSKETKEILSKKRSEYLASAKNAGGFKDVGWYEVQNINNKKFIVRGLWQYNVALKLNELNILWIKNQYLNYFIDDIKKTYNPDFYLPDLDEYIEVKGYFSEKDKIKMDAVLDQNPDVKIRFMQNQAYSNFINNYCSINEIPLYMFGKFNSGYKRKGQVKIAKEIKYCLACGIQLKHISLKYCSVECANKGNQKIKLTDQQKIELLSKYSIQQIADMYGITYNAVKKWKKKLICN